jgi:hypothetical protein
MKQMEMIYEKDSNRYGYGLDRFGLLHNPPADER